MSVRRLHSSDEAAAAGAGSGQTSTSQQLPQSGPPLTFTKLMDLCLSEQAAAAGQTRLNQADIERLRISFSSQTAACCVCACPVTVYQKVEQPQTPRGAASAVESTWQLAYQPSALILLMPYSCLPDQPSIHSDLMLVSPSICFPLWTLRLHTAVQYSVTHLFFQTVADTGDRAAVYGLAFLDAEAATEFSGRVTVRMQEMADYAAISVRERRQTFKEKERRGKSMRRLLSRSRSSGNGGFTEISSPCICQRVASATVQDCDKFAEVAFAAAGPPPAAVGGSASLEEPSAAKAAAEAAAAAVTY